MTVDNELATVPNPEPVLLMVNFGVKTWQVGAAPDQVSLS
jgi:hypothetical protein